MICLADNLLMQKKIFVIMIFLIALQAAFAQNSGDYSEESEGSQTSLYTAKQQQLRITAENVRLVPDSKKAAIIFM